MPVKVTSNSTSTTSSPSTKPVLHEGSSGSAVKELQKKLSAAGFDPGPVDGVFGPKTESAVKKFQKAHGLAADGVVGSKTWGALAGASSSAPSSSSSADGAHATVKRGSKGAAVKEMQKKLAAAGYSPGAADGVFGAHTESALKSFQRAHGLAADGVCGPKTWAALDGAKPVTPTAPANVSDLRKKILSIAEGELGLREVGENRGDILKYPRYFGRGAEPWCADFCSWVYTHAGVPMNNASCGSIVSHLKATGKWKTGNPQPGDLVLFDWKNDDGWSDHIGIVVSVNKDGTLNTIEGNAKNSSGVQGVYRHTRSTSGVLGYGNLY